MFCAIHAEMLRLAVLAAILVAACGKDSSKGEKAGSGSPAPVAGPCTKAKPQGPIAWIEDDWPAAVACARERKVPIMLDVWAPWCHTCISMQTTVFVDPSLAARKDQFVFASIDADREVNAVATGKFATSAMPTFYVISPDEQVLSRFVGAATLQELQQFLDAGARAMAGGIAASDAHLLAAERAMAAKDHETADRELTAALASGEPWPRRLDAIYSLQLTKKKRGDHLGCVTVSDRYMDAIGASAMATNFWATALECAGDLAKDPPAGADPAVAKSVQERSVANLAKLLDDPKAQLSIDDRSEAMGYLRDALDASGKKDEAKAVAEKLRAHLDDGWAKAPSAFARLTYAWPRAEAYAWLGRPLDLVADYEKLSSDLPSEYDPAARLGWLYMKAGKFAEAATWTDKAIGLVYGPRKARVLNQRAEIAKAAGDAAAERKYREETVKLWESLPDGQKNPDALAKAKSALDSMSGPAAPAGSGSQR
jgi:tetratricopeptide (TPR) repeat protein